MKRSGKVGGASGKVGRAPPGMSGQHGDTMPPVRDKSSARAESGVIDAVSVVQSREESAAAREDTAHVRESAAELREDAAHVREDAVHLREDAAQRREGAASSREGELRAAKALRSASDGQLILLQQVNSRLVIATIEAQKLAEQVQTATAQLETAKLMAEKANRAKSDFLSGMSHDLRTPLNAILGFSQLLEGGSPPPTATQKLRLQQIIKAGWYLLELINEILDLSVIESGRLSVARERVSLSEVMRECEALIESQAQQRGIRISFMPCDSNCFVTADRTRVKQVLINLLSNAIKYNREQGTVEVKCSASTPRRIRVGIKDSGAGLPPEKLAQLFQPFNRLGQEAGEEEGTGIGLVVTKQLVELMGGAIGVESTVGTGSEFWFELNRNLTPHPAAEDAMPVEPAASARERAALRTLLYVEDNPANLLLVEQIIGEHPDMRLLSACDAAAGIALAHAHVPDVIVMDIHLPGISGTEALKSLRADPATAHIPVIALSANAMLSDVEEGLDAGFLRYITKPINVDEFVSALDDAMKHSATGSTNKLATGQIP